MHAALAGQCAHHIPFLLQVTRSQQFPRSPEVGASSTPSSAVSAEMMGNPCLPTVGLPCWWRKMAPSLRFVMIRRELQAHPDLAGSGLGRWGYRPNFTDTRAGPKMCREGECFPARSSPFPTPPQPPSPHFSLPYWWELYEVRKKHPYILPLAHSLQDPKLGRGVEGLVGSSDRDLGREGRVEGALPAQPLPTAHPSPVPASRGQGPGLRQDLRCHRPGRDPGAQLLQGGPCPAALSLQSLEGGLPRPGREVSAGFPPWGFPVRQLQPSFFPHSR